jgi:hypothetical protein
LAEHDDAVQDVDDAVRASNAFTPVIAEHAQADCDVEPDGLIEPVGQDEHDVAPLPLYLLAPQVVHVDPFRY